MAGHVATTFRNDREMIEHGDLKSIARSRDVRTGAFKWGDESGKCDFERSTTILVVGTTGSS